MFGLNDQTVWWTIRGLSSLNLIFINFSFPVKRKRKHLPQCNIYPDFHSEVKFFFKYADWFNSGFFYYLMSLYCCYFFLIRILKIKFNKVLCNFSLSFFITTFSLLKMCFKVKIKLSITLYPVALCVLPVIYFILQHAKKITRDISWNTVMLNLRIYPQSSYNL